MPLDTQPDWERELAAHVAEVSGDDFLSLAATRLIQALGHPRWDCAAMLCVQDAIDALIAAGRGDLAERLDDVNGGDMASVLVEVTKERGSDD